MLTPYKFQRIKYTILDLKVLDYWYVGGFFLNINNIVNIQPEKIDSAIEVALKTIDLLLEDFTYRFPGTFTKNNIYKLREASTEDETVESFEEGDNFGWTTAFWTGMLWLAYELTGKSKYRNAAEIHLKSFEERIKLNLDVNTHDLGFLYTLSNVSAYKLTKNSLARETALKASNYLMKRYLSNCEIIQAHGSLNDIKNQGKTLIDCMMNLPLLYWSSEQTQNEKYYESAYNHAQKTLKYFIREDGSTYHTFYFDYDTGKPRYGETLQGYSNESAWARGQSWGIYGFILSYAYTKDINFLNIAKTLSNYYLDRLPKDFVAYWDLIFDDNSGEEKDSSSAAITVCGLMELSKWVQCEEEKIYYTNKYNSILESLIDNYSNKDLNSNSLLKHGVFFKKLNKGVNEASLYGDYFYLEALVRKKLQWEKYW